MLRVTPAFSTQQQGQLLPWQKHVTVYARQVKLLAAEQAASRVQIDQLIVREVLMPRRSRPLSAMHIQSGTINIR